MTPIAVCIATLIATTDSDAAETPAPPRGHCLLHDHGGADCSFTSKAQCEATAFDQGAECYPDNGDVYLASWSGHCFASITGDPSSCPKSYNSEEPAAAR